MQLNYTRTQVSESLTQNAESALQRLANSNN